MPRLGWVCSGVVCGLFSWPTVGFPVPKPQVKLLAQSHRFKYCEIIDKIVGGTFFFLQQTTTNNRERVLFYDTSAHRANIFPGDHNHPEKGKQAVKQ